MSTTAVAAPAGDSAPAAVKRPSGKTASTKKAEHPTYREMISCALGAMKERKGTSRQKIQKYIVDTYKLDLSASNSHLKRALTSGVEKGAFLRTTGKGASGSFKLAKVAPMISAGPKRKKKAAAKKPAAKKAAAKKRVKKTAAKKKATKKTAAKKRPVKKSAKKPAASKKAASKKKVTKKKPAKKAPSKKASTKKSAKKC